MKHAEPKHRMVTGTSGPRRSANSKKSDLSIVSLASKAPITCSSIPSPSHLPFAKLHAIHVFFQHEVLEAKNLEHQLTDNGWASACQGLAHVLRHVSCHTIFHFSGACGHMLTVALFVKWLLKGKQPQQQSASSTKFFAQFRPPSSASRVTPVTAHAKFFHAATTKNCQEHKAMAPWPH